MIIASIQSDFGLALTVFCCFFGLVIGVAMLVLRLICRKIGNDFRKEGGLQGWAKKSAPKMAGKLLRRVILKKW